MMMLQVNVDADADSTEIMQHRQDIESERLYLKKLRRASTGSWQRGRRITDPELFSVSRDYFTQSTREQDMDIRFTSKHKEKGKENFAVSDETKYTVVYTDGACRGNGKASSIAGIGVWYGPDDPRFVAVKKRVF